MTHHNLRSDPNPLELLSTLQCGVAKLLQLSSLGPSEPDRRWEQQDARASLNNAWWCLHGACRAIAATCERPCTPRITQASRRRLMTLVEEHATTVYEHAQVLGLVPRTENGAAAPPAGEHHSEAELENSLVMLGHNVAIDDLKPAQPAASESKERIRRRLFGSEVTRDER